MPYFPIVFIYISYTVILIKEGENVNKFGIYYASSFIIEQICSILLIFRHLFYKKKTDIGHFFMADMSLPVNFVILVPYLFCQVFPANTFYDI